MCLWVPDDLLQPATETWCRRRRRRVPEVDYVYSVSLAFIYVASVACGRGKLTALHAGPRGGGGIVGVVQCADERIVTALLHTVACDAMQNKRFVQYK
jgi:hypothetical protein